MSHRDPCFAFVALVNLAAWKCASRAQLEVFDFHRFTPVSLIQGLAFS
jgi:hypothetical protein